MVAVSVGLLVLQAAQGGIDAFKNVIGTLTGVGLTDLLSAAGGLALVAGSLTLLGYAGIASFAGLMLASVGLGMMIPGLMALSAVAQTDIISQLGASLTSIAAAGGGLLAVGGALFAIAGGLGAIAGAGLFALPVIGALTALASVAPALTSLAEAFGGGGGGAEAGGAGAKEDKMDILIEEIRALKAEMSKGGVVNMDGRKVGETLRLAMNTSGVR